MSKVKYVKTVCRSCHGGCGVIAHVKSGKVVKTDCKKLRESFFRRANIINLSPNLNVDDYFNGTYAPLDASIVF